MKVLLTGASGFLGRWLASDLKMNGFDVIGISFSSSETEFLRCNLTLEAEYVNIPACDVIIHLAQSPVYKDYPAKANEIFKVNVLATQYLLDFARKSGVSRFIYMSSGSVYDLSTNAVLSEASPLKPNSYYAQTKLAAEQLVMTYSSFFQTISLRLFNPFSHVNNGKLVTNILSSIEAGEEIYLSDEEGLKMNPLYVKDMNRAILTVLSNATIQSDVYNLGGPDSCSLREFVLSYSRLSNKEPRFVKQQGSSMNMIASMDKFTSTFKFDYKFNLEEALADVYSLRMNTRC
jgi:UDP-glucose 4-epimerase